MRARNYLFMIAAKIIAVNCTPVRATHNVQGVMYKYMCAVALKGNKG